MNLRSNQCARNDMIHVRRLSGVLRIGLRLKDLSDLSMHLPYTIVASGEPEFIS